MRQGLVPPGAVNFRVSPNAMSLDTKLQHSPAYESPHLHRLKNQLKVDQRHLDHLQKEKAQYAQQLTLDNKQKSSAQSAFKAASSWGWRQLQTLFGTTMEQRLASCEKRVVEKRQEMDRISDYLVSLGKHSSHVSTLQKLQKLIAPPPLVRASGRKLLSVGLPDHEELLHTYVTSDQNRPVVIAHPTSGFWVTYNSDGQDSDNGGVYNARIAEDGTITPEVRLSSSFADNQDYGSVAFQSNGDYLTAYDFKPPGLEGLIEAINIYHVCRNSADVVVVGETQSHPNSDAGGTQRKAQAMTLPNGEYRIAFESSSIDGDGYGIGIRRFDASCSAIGGASFRANQVTANDQLQPRMAAFSDSSYILVYQSEEISGGNKDILFAIYDSSDSLIASGTATITTANNQQNPSVVVDKFDIAHIVFQSNHETVISDDIYLQAIDIAGNKVYPADIDLTPGVVPASRGRPNIALLDDSVGFVVAWNSANEASPTSGTDVVANFYDYNIRPVGDPLLLNDVVTAATQQRATIACQSSICLAAWQDESVGGNDEVRGRLLEAPFPYLITNTLTVVEGDQVLPVTVSNLDSGNYGLYNLTNTYHILSFSNGFFHYNNSIEHKNQFNDSQIMAGDIYFSYNGFGNAPSGDFLISNGYYNSSVTPFNITYLTINTPPMLGNVMMNVTEDDVFVSSLVSVIDPDIEQVTVNFITIPTSGTIIATYNGTHNITMSFYPGDAFQYLAEGETVVMPFSYYGNDTLSFGPYANGSVLVIGKNDPPVANDAYFECFADVSPTLYSLNYTDLDVNDTLNFTVTALSSNSIVNFNNGSILVDLANRYQYLALHKETLVKVASYAARDPHNISSTWQDVWLRILGRNDKPVAGNVSLSIADSVGSTVLSHFMVTDPDLTDGHTFDVQSTPGVSISYPGGGMTEVSATINFHFPALDANKTIHDIHVPYRAEDSHGVKSNWAYLNLHILRSNEVSSTPFWSSVGGIIALSAISALIAAFCGIPLWFGYKRKSKKIHNEEKIYNEKDERDALYLKNYHPDGFFCAPCDKQRGLGEQKEKSVFSLQDHDEVFCTTPRKNRLYEEAIKKEQNLTRNRTLMIPYVAFLKGIRNKLNSHNSKLQTVFMSYSYPLENADENGEAIRERWVKPFVKKLVDDLRMLGLKMLHDDADIGRVGSSHAGGRSEEWMKDSIAKADDAIIVGSETFGYKCFRFKPGNKEAYATRFEWEKMREKECKRKKDDRQAAKKHVPFILPILISGSYEDSIRKVMANVDNQSVMPENFIHTSLTDFSGCRPYIELLLRLRVALFVRSCAPAMKKNVDGIWQDTIVPAMNSLFEEGFSAGLNRITKQKIRIIKDGSLSVARKEKKYGESLEGSFARLFNNLNNGKNVVEDMSDEKERLQA